MPRSLARAALVALVPALFAAPSLADDIEPKIGAPASEGTREADADAETTRVAVVDVGALPIGALPTLPADTEAPAGVPAFTQPSTVTVEVVEQLQRSPKRRPPPILGLAKVAMRKKKLSTTTKMVRVRSTTHTLDALYFPSAESLEHDASAEQRMPCGDRESVTPVRWETLTATPDGNAELEVRDLWFDAKTCAVGPGSTKTISLRAIAWENGKPWLFAMRGHTGVTLVMPHTSEMTAESMVGAPVSVRGDFTRVTLPMGRWGSGTVVAQLEGLAIGAKTDSAENGEDRPVEVGIEIVQTMSERAPTLLVRTRRAPAEPTGERD